MPRVRIDRSQGSQISTQPVRGGQMNVQTTGETFGGGTGLAQTEAAFQGVLDTAQKTVATREIRLREEAEKQKKIADGVMAQDAKLLAAKLQTDIETNVSKMQGKDAAGASDYAGKEWQTKGAEIRATLANDEQRAEFDEDYKNRSAQIYKATQNHMSDQFLKSTVKSTQDYMDNELDRGVRNYKDIGAIQSSIDNQEQSFLKVAQVMGYDKPSVEKGLRDIRTKTHTAVINRMLAQGESKLATEYYNANKDQLDDSVSKETMKIIQDETENIASIDKANEIMGKVGNNLQAVEGELNSIDNEDVRKKVKDKVTVMVDRLRTQLDANEAQVAGLIANGQYDIEKLQNGKPGMTPDFYNIVRVAMNNGSGDKLGKPPERANNFIAFTQKYNTVFTGELGSRTEALMNFRRDVLASRQKLDEDQFKALLSWTDPNFVVAAEPKKTNMVAGMEFLKGMALAGRGTPAGLTGMMASFIADAMSKDTKPEDIPQKAQNKGREIAYLNNSALIGKTDVTNLAVNKQDGVKTVYPGQTKSKADATVTKPDVPKGYIEMISPNGGRSAVPPNNVEAAKKRGYKVVNGNS